MTGFANTTVSLPVRDQALHISMSLKTLNSRFFESSCKLPHTLTELETACLRIFKTRLVRGSVFFTVYIHNTALLKGDVILSQNMIKNYLSAINNLKQSFSLPGEITVSEIMTLPHIFEIPEESLSPELINVLLVEINKLIDTVIAERKREGAHLHQDLMQRAAIMQDLLKKIEPRAQLVITEKRESITASWMAIAPADQQTKDQHLLMLYGQLDRIDIHEEIVRFKTHLEHLQKILNNSDEEKGKKLDFILQEMFREVNTMNAKCSDSQISEYAISLKVELEKSREQVQNIV